MLASRAGASSRALEPSHTMKAYRAPSMTAIAAMLTRLIFTALLRVMFVLLNAGFHYMAIVLLLSQQHLHAEIGDEGRRAWAGVDPGARRCEQLHLGAQRQTHPCVQDHIAAVQEFLAK